MMNYVSVAPNFQFVAPQTAPSFGINPSFNENRPLANFILLNTISQALRLSLRNYQQHLTNLSTVTLNNQEESLSNKEKLINSQKVIEIIIPEDDGEKINTDISQSTNKESLKSPMLSQKKPALNVLAPTDDENLLEPKIVSNRKDCQSKRRIKKNICQYKTNSFEFPIPEVDLIETAYLPQQKAVFDNLYQKREQLLLRRVRDCNEFTKTKRQRREIRMLGN